MNKDNKLELTILYKTGKKYRRIAKSTIHLYKKYFIGGNNHVSKWVHMELLQNSFEHMGQETLILSAMNNMGKVYMNAEVKQDEIDESKFRNKAKVVEAKDLKTAYNTIIHNDLKVLSDAKDRATQNKTDKFKSVVEGNNEFLKNIKEKLNNQPNENDLYEDIIDFGKYI